RTGWRSPLDASASSRGWFPRWTVDGTRVWFGSTGRACASASPGNTPPDTRLNTRMRTPYL
ncbi:hypothetical protein XENOCAPTIV_017641, partial [Xenoophorus captivus]